MADKHILHLLSPLKHASPFDANMALDAGFDAVLPYANVALGDVVPLVQDAMFSRPPKLGVRTGMFFGGKNALLALDMLEAARGGLVPPFAISLFADPAGSFTTAAAMVACVEKALSRRARGLKGLKVAVFGATGVVGFSSAVIAALEGAEATLVGHDGVERVADAAREIETRFGVATRAVDGSSEARKDGVLRDAEAVLCAGRAGMRILTREQVEGAARLLVAADVNAVPPVGIDGLDAMADGAPLGSTGAIGIGALAIGRIKSATEAGLFRRMIAAERAVSLDFRDAFGLARELVGQN